MFGYRFEPVEGADGYTTFALGGDPLGGLGGLYDPEAPGWATCFSVADTDEAVRLAEAGGGGLRQPPQDTPWGRFALLRDPAGAAFSVMGTGSPA